MDRGRAGSPDLLDPDFLGTAFADYDDALNAFDVGELDLPPTDAPAPAGGDRPQALASAAGRGTGGGAGAAEGAGGGKGNGGGAGEVGRGGRGGVGEVGRGALWEGGRGSETAERGSSDLPATASEGSDGSERGRSTAEAPAGWWGPGEGVGAGRGGGGVSGTVTGGRPGATPVEVSSTSSEGSGTGEGDAEDRQGDSGAFSDRRASAGVSALAEGPAVAAGGGGAGAAAAVSDRSARIREKLEKMFAGYEPRPRERHVGRARHIIVGRFPEEDRPFVPAVLAEMCQDRTMECRSDKRLLPMTRALQIMPLSHIMNLAPLDGSHSYFHVPKRTEPLHCSGRSNLDPSIASTLNDSVVNAAPEGAKWGPKEEGTTAGQALMALITETEQALADVERQGSVGQWVARVVHDHVEHGKAIDFQTLGPLGLSYVRVAWRRRVGKEAERQYVEAQGSLGATWRLLAVLEEDLRVVLAFVTAWRPSFQHALGLLCRTHARLSHLPTCTCPACLGRAPPGRPAWADAGAELALATTGFEPATLRMEAAGADGAAGGWRGDNVGDREGFSLNIRRVVTGLLHHVVWASLDPNMAEYLKAYMECFFALAEKHIRATLGIGPSTAIGSVISKPANTAASVKRDDASGAAGSYEGRNGGAGGSGRGAGGAVRGRGRPPKKLSGKCHACGSTKTKQWRHVGPHLVCNPCGVFFHRKGKFPDPSSRKHPRSEPHRLSENGAGHRPPAPAGPNSPPASPDPLSNAGGRKSGDSNSNSNLNSGRDDEFELEVAMHRLPLSPTPEDDAFETRATKRRKVRPRGQPVGMGIYDEDGEELYCICLADDSEERNFVQCEACHDWLHPECVGLDWEAMQRVEHYQCPRCAGGTLLLEWTPDRKGVVVRGTQPLPIPPSGLVRRRNDGEWVVVSVRDYMNRSA